MAKQIVTKDKIIEIEALTIIKAFRIANKRAGEAKVALQQISDNVEQSNQLTSEQERLIDLYSDYCDKLKMLSEKAKTLQPASECFNIWVNFNGRTGHTYNKDYKVTLPEDNNYFRHVHEVEQMQTEINNRLDSTTNSNNEHEENFEDDNE